MLCKEHGHWACFFPLCYMVLLHHQVTGHMPHFSTACGGNRIKSAMFTFMRRYGPETQPWLILLSIIEMLLKMSFYRSLSYFVNACLLDSARKNVKCFHLHLKICLFLWLTSLSEVPRIHPHTSKSRKLLGSCSINQNFGGFFLKSDFTSKPYQQMCLGGVNVRGGYIVLLKSLLFCCL